MADGVVQVAPDNPAGKNIDTTELTVNSKVVERERVQVAGAGAADLADVRNAAPGATDNGLVTRNIPSGTQPISSADGQQATIGSTSDTSVANTLVGLLKRLLSVLPSALVGGRLEVNVGAVGVVVTTDPSDRVARLVGHVSLDSGGTLKGQAVAANSIPVVLDSDTDRGQKTMANSLPVTIASDQGDLKDNIDQVGGTAVVTSLAGALGVGGDTVDGNADAGKSVKVGGLVLPNKTALFAGRSVNQRWPVMVDEFGRLRVVVNRPQLQGLYYFESGRIPVQAVAHSALVGFFWLINPVGSSVVAIVKKLHGSATPTSTTALVSAPRITVERVTFTGTASGGQITAAKRDSTDANAVATLRTASTGLTLTAGAIIEDFIVGPVVTAIGIATPVEQSIYEASRDDDDGIVLRGGEGIVVRQPDAGTTGDNRLFVVTGSWEEK